MIRLSRTKRYAIASVLLFIAVTASDRAYLMESTETSLTLSSGTIRCAIVLEDEMYSSKGLCTGFNYEMVRKFAANFHAEAEIYVGGQDSESYLDSLRKGRIDMVVIPSDSREFCDSVIYSMNTGCGTVWAVRTGNMNDIRSVNSWMSHFVMTEEYSDMVSRFLYRKNTEMLCPYEPIIRKYARNLEWDWRMLAAVIYQESRFSINSRSSRGASGLMQVMPSTAEYYGIEDLTDPENNIRAGCMHLGRLQKMFREENMENMERIKYTLAAYNAGEGRISDCRNLAESQGFDSNIWEETARVIPLMREDSILQNENVRFGKFNGEETIKYVDNIMEIYGRFCRKYPS